MSFYDLPFFSTTNKSAENGKDGISPTILITDITGGHRLTITDSSGTKTIDVMNGATGPRGEQGPQGIQGIQRPQGIQGTPGEQGEKGERGEKGDKGDKGDKGEPGNDGQAGKDGENGKDGAAGKSAYEYATDGGYSGTEVEFIELLANTVDKRNIAIGLHTDGLLYLFIDGAPVGTGVTLTANTEA
jgi:hypothetical protein